MSEQCTFISDEKEKRKHAINPKDPFEMYEVDKACLQDALLDAGYPKEKIQRIIEIESIEGKICVLQHFRKTILQELHDSQKRLDVLDYIIHSLTSERKAKNQREE